MADIAHPIYERIETIKKRLYIDKEQIALETMKSEIYKQNVLIKIQDGSRR